MSTPQTIAEPEQPEQPEKPGSRRRHPVAAAVALGFAFLLVALLSVHAVRDGMERLVGATRPATTSSGTDSTALARTASTLERRLDSMRPRGAYLVVSSSDNRFALMQGADTLRAGLCSTGSYVHLTAGDGRSWLFTTPRGRRTVLEKRVRPVWAKPDWAFIESGEPVPPTGAPERFERGVLGKYALSLGDGYLVHGTPYQRLLGMPVTHGCVRLGDEDLEVVYRSLGIGSPVILY